MKKFNRLITNLLICLTIIVALNACNKDETPTINQVGKWMISERITKIIQDSSSSTQTPSFTLELFKDETGLIKDYDEYYFKEEMEWDLIEEDTKINLNFTQISPRLSIIKTFDILTDESNQQIWEMSSVGLRTIDNESVIVYTITKWTLEKI